LSNNNVIINNLPEHIETLYIAFGPNIKLLNNFPITLKEIIVSKEDVKYIQKPYGAIITNKYLKNLYDVYDSSV
jgi:hypothetical protein